MVFGIRGKTAILLSIFAACMVGIGAMVALPKAEAAPTWQPLSEVVSEQQLTQIITENTARSANRDEIAASALGYTQGDLLVIDFKTPMLCGVGGCAIAGYQISTGDRILTTYANQTSPNQPIVELVERDDVDLPCLLVTLTQSSTEEMLCYRNEEWATESI